MLVLSCVSPFYGTARIEPGLHIDAGLAGVSYMDSDERSDLGYYYGTDPSSPHYYGIRGDVELRYGIGKYLQGSVRTDLGWGFNGKIYVDYYTSAKDDFLVDLAIGLQLAGPILFDIGGQVTPAVRLEVCYGYGEFFALPTVLVGIGEPEFFTLGTRFYAFPIIPGEILAGIHIRRFDVFVGYNLGTALHPDYWRIPPVATVGLGYNLK